MAANLTAWKREEGMEWLKNAPSQALQHALKDLEKAYKNFLLNVQNSHALNVKAVAIVFVIPNRNK